jgi:hypothetical protein
MLVEGLHEGAALVLLDKCGEIFEHNQILAGCIDMAVY